MLFFFFALAAWANSVSPILTLASEKQPANASTVQNELVEEDPSPSTLFLFSIELTDVDEANEANEANEATDTVGIGTTGIGMVDNTGGNVIFNEFKRVTIFILLVVVVPGDAVKLLTMTEDDLTTDRCTALKVDLLSTILDISTILWIMVLLEGN